MRTSPTRPACERRRKRPALARRQIGVNVEQSGP